MVTIGLNVLVIGLSTLAVLLGDPRPWMLVVASLLGLYAFGLMWVHYVVDAFNLEESTSRSYKFGYRLSRIMVLIAIIAHPLLINAYLFSLGYGLPPVSYETFLGGAAWAVLLGWAALAAFIAFEFKSKLKRFSRVIFHANAVAMFLVLIHGFLVGMVALSGWFVWVWWLYTAVFTIAIGVRYHAWYGTNTARRTMSFVIIAVLAVGVLLSGLSGASSDDSVKKETRTTDSAMLEGNDAPTQNDMADTPTISLDELATSNGKDGAKCLIAIDGTVYDASDNSQWSNGEHTPSNGRAKCGEDLTDAIRQSPHGKSVLGELPTVGSLGS